MKEESQGEDNIVDEFRTLARNLVETSRSVWESPERKKLQQEIETGLTELAATLKQEAHKFGSSPTGQELKAELDDLKERFRSGEAEEAARREILSALQIVNAELEKAVSRWKAQPPSSEDDFPN